VPDLSPTPLVVDIARRLQADGRFVMRVEPHGWRRGQLQAVVDVSWAARQAGRMLDRSVRVTTTRATDTSDIYTVTAEVVR
jgi:hypothetical protein